VTVSLTWTRDPLALILTTLAAYRLARLWISDTLPPLPRLRMWLGDRIQDRWDTRTLYKPSMGEAKIARLRKTRRLYNDTPPLTYLLDCYWCSGFWISLATVIAASLIPTPAWTVISLPLALSAVVGLIGSRD
jgi:Protein of unknown function (DUF1360)